MARIKSHYTWKASGDNFKGSRMKYFLYYKDTTNTEWSIEYSKKQWDIYYNLQCFLSGVKGKEEAQRIALAIMEYREIKVRIFTSNDLFIFPADEAHYDNRILKCREIIGDKNLTIVDEIINKEISRIQFDNWAKERFKDTSDEASSVTDTANSLVNTAVETTEEKDAPAESGKPKHAGGRPKTGRRYWRIWANEDEHAAINALLKGMRKK